MVYNFQERGFDPAVDLFGMMMMIDDNDDDDDILKGNIYLNQDLQSARQSLVLANLFLAMENRK